MCLHRVVLRRASWLVLVEDGRPFPLLMDATYRFGKSLLDSMIRHAQLEDKCEPRTPYSVAGTVRKRPPQCHEGGLK